MKTGSALSLAQRRSRRLAVAIALSIAAHEVLAGLIPASSDRSPAVRESLSDVRILTVRRLATPAPRPIPTPVERLVFTHALRAVPAREGASGAPSARRRIAMHPVKLAVHRAAFAAHFETKPVWDAASTGTGSQSGTASANGSGNGSGAGAQGAGTAAVKTNEPCGFVTFSDPHGSQYDSRTRGFYVDIRMSVHFADGSNAVADPRLSLVLCERSREPVVGPEPKGSGLSHAFSGASGREDPRRTPTRPLRDGAQYLRGHDAACGLPRRLRRYGATTRSKFEIVMLCRADESCDVHVGAPCTSFAKKIVLQQPVS